MVPPGGLAAYRPQQLYSLFNADVPVTDIQVRMTEVAADFRRFERQSDSSRVIGARDRALQVAFRSLADSMAAFSAGCQLSADLITYVDVLIGFLLLCSLISLCIIIVIIDRRPLLKTFPGCAAFLLVAPFPSCHSFSFSSPLCLSPPFLTPSLLLAMTRVSGER